MTDAVIEPTFVSTGVTNADLVVWYNLDSDDSGKPIKFAKYSDKTVQFYGTFGSGGTVVLEGSNDPRANPENANHANAVWFTLTDAQANTVEKSAAAGEVVQENPLWLRPRVTSGDGTTSITCALCGKRSI